MPPGSRQIARDACKHTITRLRFERAQALLKQNDLPIAEVASLCGFATASHFATMFKRTYGQTPFAYRKN